MNAMEPEFPTYRIGLVEDHLEMARAALHGFFQPYPELRLVADGHTVAELLSVTTELDLVILDLQGLPDKSTPKKNIRALKDAGIANVLVYTSRDRRYLVQEAAKAGVLGVITKTEPAGKLVEAVRLAVTGQAAPSVDWAAALDADAELIPQLTERERKVLAMYASGDTAIDIATELHLAPDTIRKYVAKIKDKYTEAGFEVRKKGDLAARARVDGYFQDWDG
ncbi:LuxR C-terminal-related transcriptional regulator [Nocardia yamanashiensis]|uniref:LuxR C-terminal-related transcriptional regulator n=1 Tax=Nocardia yamanashiensis TaxID=209247 RepID=UPI0009FF3C84|nr:response regulator transcription factor [Nocardia yamanashiensis]